MTKLLHERLRAINDSWPNTIKIGKVDVCLYPVEAQALADEIERYYIPLPCDPNGKPWNIGDPVRALNATSDSHVTGYIYDGESVIQTDAGRYKPDQLTHKEPDSLEKLRDDMEQYHPDFDAWSEMLDRLSALIERGA